MVENELQSPERDTDEFTLDARIVSGVLDAVEADDAARVAALTEDLHPADIADLLEQIGPADRRALIALWPDAIDGDVLSELDEGLREDLIPTLPHSVLREAVRDLESDDVVDLIEDLEEPEQEIILRALGESDRAAVEQSLAYPEHSAGRLMQREVVTAPEHWTVGETIDFLRGDVELPDQFYHVILIDPRWHPTGYVTLGKLLSSKRSVALRDIAEDSFRTIDVMDEEGDVAYAFNQYHLISAPVVDENERLVGVITIDDAMAVLDEEHEEDILRLAGVGEGSLSDSVAETTKQRLPWLAVNLLTAILASTVIAQFEDVISKVVALAVLMPIVASMGGNAGTQGLTVAVRAIATRDLTGANVWRVIRREVTVGLLNGLVFAAVMGVVGGFWFGSAVIGAVLAAAMVINLVVAGLGGIVVPLTLEKIGVDPALASGTFVTTLTDVMGFFAFLGLATLILL